ALVPQPPPPDQQQVDVDLRTVAIQLECANVRCTGVLLKINQQDVTWETLGPRLQDIFKTRAEKVVFVKAADDLEFSHVARAIDIAKGAGVDKIGLITAKIEMGE
ncbi:MAG: ExbD/TolR family protein, partial [Candidatus Acidiferrales bacterium]